VLFYRHYPNLKIEFWHFYDTALHGDPNVIAIQIVVKETAITAQHIIR